MSHKPPSHRFPLSLRTPHTLTKAATVTAPKHSKRTRTKPPAQRRSLTSLLYPVTSHVPLFTDKNNRNVHHTNNALTKQSRHGGLHWSLPLKNGIIEQALPFRLICGRCFFCDSVFRRAVPAGGRVVGAVLSSGAASPHHFGWVVLFFPIFCWVVLHCSSLLLGGAAFLALLRVVVLSSLRPLGRCFFFFSKKKNAGNLPAAPKRRGRNAARPKGGGGQAAPPAREGRDSSTTEREEKDPLD